MQLIERPYSQSAVRIVSVRHVQLANEPFRFFVYQTGSSSGMRITIVILSVHVAVAQFVRLGIHPHGVEVETNGIGKALRSVGRHVHKRSAVQRRKVSSVCQRISVRNVAVIRINISVSLSAAIAVALALHVYASGRTVHGIRAHTLEIHGKAFGSIRNGSELDAERADIRKRREIAVIQRTVRHRRIVGAYPGATALFRYGCTICDGGV